MWGRRLLSVLSRACAMAIILSLCLSTAHALSPGSVSADAAGHIGLAPGPAAPVAGDYQGIGAEVAIDQPVAGQLTLIGASIDVLAPVGGDVRAVGGRLRLHSAVGGHVHATVGAFTQAETASIAGDLFVTAGQALIEGTVGGAVTAQAQRVRINGEVAGDVWVSAQLLELGPQARVIGRLRYDAAQLVRDASAEVGEVYEIQTTRPVLDHEPWSEGAWWWLLMPMSLALLMVGGALLVALSPVATRASRHITHHPWQVLLLGAGLIVGWAVLAFVLMFTVLGIPWGVLMLSAMPPLLFLGWMVGAVWWGQWMAKRRDAGEGQGAVPPLGWTLLAALGLLLLVWVPVLGPALWVLAILAGLGGCVRAWRMGPAEGTSP